MQSLIFAFMKGNAVQRYIWPLVLIMLMATVSMGQKIELEERIPETDFPKMALEEVRQKFPQGRRVKFYREISQADSLTFEAKLLSDGHWYSVEFYPDGTLVDIEKRVKFKSLPEAVREQIRKRWERDFRKSRVVKCQEQRSSEGIRYEIEMRGKDESGTDFYQYLFADDGTFLNREKIELRPSDMTLY